MGRVLEAVKDVAWRLTPVKKLNGGNVYESWRGRYRTSGIPDTERRDMPEHWDGQFQNAQSFRDAWPPSRPGPLEFVYNASQARREQGTTRPFEVINLGAGLGDFSIDLAKLPGVNVAHVDFSQRANSVARENLVLANQQAERELSLTIATADNRAYLRERIRDRRKADAIFIYGGLAENTPTEKVTKQTLRLAADALNPGGYLWFVGLEQPKLVDRRDDRATDILGEFPTRPALITRALRRRPEMQVVKQVQGERPDNHPLVPGGESVAHMHIIRRALLVKGGQVEKSAAPQFDFSKAVSPGWDATWQQIQGGTNASR